MKTLGIIIVVVIIIGTIMFATNPIKDDFNNFMENKAARNIKKYADGSIGRVDKLINTTNPVTGMYSESQFERINYYVFSIYKSDSLVLEDGNKYLGLFKIFIILE